MAAQTGEYVVAVKGFGGVVREAVPAGARGQVVEASWLGPVRVRFDPYDWWNGHRQVLGEVQSHESP